MAEPMTPHLDEARRVGGVKALLAERDQLRADLARARQRIDAALAVHQPRQTSELQIAARGTVCQTCGSGKEDDGPSSPGDFYPVPYPCATVRALTGAGQVAHECDPADCCRTCERHATPHRGCILR